MAEGEREKAGADGGRSGGCGSFCEVGDRRHEGIRTERQGVCVSHQPIHRSPYCKTPYNRSLGLQAQFKAEAKHTYEHTRPTPTKRDRHTLKGEK